MASIPPHTSEAIAAYREMRDQVRHDDHRDPDALIAALRVLTRTGIFDPIEKIIKADVWPPRPAHAQETYPGAQQVRHRRVVGTVRIGGFEFYAIVAETAEWMIIAAWSSTGRWIGEEAIDRVEFELKYERKE